MSTQPSVMWSVCIALGLHIVAATFGLLKTDVATLQLADLKQGAHMTLDRSTYQQVLQQQQTIRVQALVKPEIIEQVKPKKVVVKKSVKKKQNLVKAIPQKAVIEQVTADMVAYEVKAQAEQSVEEMKSETVKVASTAFTPMRTSQTAQQSDKPTAAAGGGGTAKQKPLMMNDSTQRYLAQLMRHLQRYKQYPAQLKKNHVEGKPVIRFSINKRGQVTNVEVKRHSNNAELDRAAMDVFRRASPLPKIPSELERETLTMSLPIEYSLIND